jgi:hypothetical protein
LPANAIGMKVLSTSVPAGGIFQWQLSNTEPKPIGHGSTRPTVPPGPVRGVAVNDPSGKAAGIALIPTDNSNTNIKIQLSSPDALLGTDITYPVVTMSMPLSASLTQGQTFTIGMDTARAIFADASQNYATLEFAPGTLTIAAPGSPYVADVIPGGGLLPDRSVIRILGANFNANSRVSIEGTTIILPADQTLVNSGEIDVKICNGTVADTATTCPNNGTAFQLDGERVRVKDQGTNFVIEYYTYLRADNDPAFAASGNALVAQVHPMFSRQTYLAATIPLVQTATQFTGLALQNTSGVDDGIKIELLDAGNASLANNSFILHAGKKIVRDVIKDLFGGTVPNGAAKVRMTVTSGNAPVQALGMLGDTSAGTVSPVIPQ